jgi:o-succinylbenzoate---CoA ligase
MQCPVQSRARRAPHATALDVAGRKWTYADLDGSVSEYVDWLSARGVGRGDRVCALLKNGHEVALGRLGAALVPLNWRLTTPELLGLVKRARSKCLVASASELERLPGCLELPAFCGAAARAASAELDEGSVWAVLFSSGTTGTPKAAQLTVANFVASARASAENLGTRESDAWLACLPLFHVGGLAMVVRCAVQGIPLVIQSAFEPADVNDAIDSGAVSHLSLVPTMLSRVLETRAGQRFPTTLRAVLIGGGPVPAGLLDQARELGCPVLQTYGLTEACSQVATQRPSAADGRSAGRALPGTELRVVDDLGQPAPVGIVGEVQVRGPTLMRGYLGEVPLSPRAWFSTGDLGSMDAEGRLTVASRRVDLIISGGENIYPAEVEAALLQHPSIEDAAVVGVPDPRWGQVPLALFVPRGAGDERAIESWCAGRLARFKIPRRFFAVGAVPRNAAGKLDRALAGNIVRALLSGSS